MYIILYTCTTDQHEAASVLQCLKPGFGMDCLELKQQLSAHAAANKRSLANVLVNTEWEFFFCFFRSSFYCSFTSLYSLLPVHNNISISSPHPWVALLVKQVSESELPAWDTRGRVWSPEAERGKVKEGEGKEANEEWLRVKVCKRSPKKEKICGWECMLLTRAQSSCCCTLLHGTPPQCSQ